MSINIALPIRRFFEEHLVSQRGLSPNTVLSYRDTLKLLLQFAVQQCRKECTDLTVDDLSSQLVRQFLEHLGRARKNGAGTRNVRLAAIHAFFRYLATTDPRLLAHCQSILAVPFKRQARPVAGYLEQEEVQHIFRHIDIQKPQGRRDDALLRLLYNSGARRRKSSTSTSTISGSAVPAMCASSARASASEPVPFGRRRCRQSRHFSKIGM